MFNRFQGFYNSIKLLADWLVLTVAFALAYVTRFKTSFPHESIPPWSDTITSWVMVMVVFPIAFRQANLYTTNRARSHISEVFEIFKATVFATLLLVAVRYFTSDRYSRMTIAIFMVYAFVGVSLMRLSVRAIFNHLRSQGFNLKKILVVGAGELGARIIDTIHQHRELGFTVVGVLTRRPEKMGGHVHGAKIVGLISDVDEVLETLAPDQVIIALPIDDQPLVKPLMEKLAQHTVDVKVVPDLYQYRTLRSGLEEFGGLPIISLQGAPLHGWNVVLKRAFDILFSAVGLVLISPLLVILAVLVKLSSKGPVLYRQERMGMDGHTFQMLKFRTMGLDAESDGAQMASPDDPRTTWIGAFMRRLSLDELPQLLNVLNGDMSLVGPRPERPIFIQEFKQQIPRYHLRHMVKSGITGWAQINGLRGQTSMQERIEYDLYYIENWSLLLDLKIVLRTALGGFLSKNAY